MLEGQCCWLVFAEPHVKGHSVADLRWNDILPLSESLCKQWGLFWSHLHWSELSLLKVKRINLVLN